MVNPQNIDEEVVKLKKKEPLYQSGEKTEKLKKGLYGQEPEMSLQSVNFAPTENTYLNEHCQSETKENLPNNENNTVK